MTKLATKYVLAVACATVAIAAPARANAEEVQAAASGSLSVGDATAEAHGPTGDKVSEKKEDLEEAEPKFQASVDLVLGWGKTSTVTADLPGTLATVPRATLADSRIATQSFLFGFGYEIGKGFGIGARIPLSLGSWSAPNESSRSTTAVGNLEIEGEYALHLNERMKLFFGLGIALPTAQGTELPTQDELNADPNGALTNQNAYDRFAVNHAAAASRGYLDNALFEPKRFGIIPQVGLDYTVSHVLIDPFVKMENLISTSGNPEHSYIGELVLGTFLGYEVLKQMDIGARVWTNIVFSGDTGAVGVVEPQLRFHFGNVTPLIAGIIPFAGSELTSPQFGGVRLALAARF